MSIQFIYIAYTILIILRTKSLRICERFQDFPKKDIPERHAQVSFEENCVKNHGKVVIILHVIVFHECFKES